MTLSNPAPESLKTQVCCRPRRNHSDKSRSLTVNNSVIKLVTEHGGLAKGWTKRRVRFLLPIMVGGIHTWSRHTDVTPP